MDGVFHKKISSRTSRSENGSITRDTNPTFIDDAHEYCVYELGRPYCIEHRSYLCACTRRAIDHIDARALLALNNEHTLKKDQLKSAHKFTKSVRQEDAFVDTSKIDGYVGFHLRDLPIFRHDSILVSHHISVRFFIIGALFLSGIGAMLFVGTTFAVKDNVNTSTQKAVLSIKSAMGSIAQRDYISSGNDLYEAHQQFVLASDEMGRINKIITYMAQFIPGASELSSGYHIIEAGKYLTHTAKELHDVIPAVIENDSSLLAQDRQHVSFLALYQLVADRVDNARYDLALAQEHIDHVHIDDVPKEYRETLVQIKEVLPEVNDSLRIMTESRATVEEMLGARGPRTYLILFQNNHEMRATGGFIGSYGIVRVKNGQITTMMVDDIYNIDGQLIDRIVPPLPIQKISANWSLHDSNWFVDFPVSARKAMDFYERTGGSTIDGVIAITPEVLRDFLAITGPIAVEEHGMQLTDENFMRILQDEIEDRSNYGPYQNENDAMEGQRENDDESDQKQPKKILSDLMPIVIDRLLDRSDPSRLPRVVSAVSNGLRERHIIMYMTNDHAQKIIENSGWAGTVLESDKDYLSVVNTNINGFKTDGVIEQKVEHRAQIDKDGYIVDTVVIHRKHGGGHTNYPWWDAVNANYMRIYVPEGSTLISVEGHTREINEQRLDYDALGYERDPDVVQEESSMHIDEETGTRIYNDAGKTVFANWVYVSPQESVTVKYTYRLPFRITFEKDDDGYFGSYAILFQKQSGSDNVSIESTIDIDGAYTAAWHSQDSDTLMMQNDLDTDRYNGVVLRKRSL